MILGMLETTLDVTLLKNLLAGKGVVRGGDEVIQSYEGIIRANE